ncbi:thiaminase (transcriptional activator TenA) [Kushneria avicenniae]|uniref:Aminopyrimidine aminohydrolase n=1 Tax=Kushneria avicenniae TaxID=402385 RepID=A0A1I1I818_9GAMM|nr:thiaminase II [Kushneria avicenniae]SFC31962.1 thiaminase (transcriptional activator TenA) [Kushneria avicenniae]
MLQNFDTLKNACSDQWQAYIQHPFVAGISEATLPTPAFQHYLQQDYLFLIHFARAWGLAVYKSRDMNELRHSLDNLKTIVDTEMGLHVAYCREWGIDEASLHDLPEAQETLAYTRFVLDCGHRGDLLDLHVALAPCLIGYAEVAEWIATRSQTVTVDNPYQAWIDMYRDEDYLEAVRRERLWLDERLAEVSPARFAQLTTTFRDATRLEAAFWQMGLDAAG